MTTMAEKAVLLAASGLFDEAWYVERYPDVRRCGMSPAEHYVRIGQQLGRKPKPDQDVGAVTGFLAGSRVSDALQKPLDKELRDKISASGLFDPAWYRTHYAPDLTAASDLLDDYLNRSAAAPTIDPGPLFSTTGYALANTDIGRAVPLIHAAEYGLPEGRSVFDAHKVDAFLTDCRETACSTFTDLLDASQPVSILVWQDGNFFFTEIAQYLGVYLRETGFDVSEDGGPPRPGANIIVVAPHEFCVHGPGKAWGKQQLAQAIYLNTEQWHTSWFSLAHRFIVQSGKAIDMNPASASGLQGIGIRTAFLPILPLDGTPFSVAEAALTDAFVRSRYVAKLTYPVALAERPYDVLFVGASNARREAALGVIAPVLSEHEAFVHCPRFDGPVRKGDPDMMSTSDLAQIARNAKILLNIHQGESRYFEWHRLFLFGIMEGCVVLTEPCIPNGYLHAGRDYLECELSEMPERLRWLLETADGRAEMERVRANCERLRQGSPQWMKVAA